MTDIDWALIGRYAAGECTDAERAEIERWLAASPARRATVDAIGRVTAQSDRAASPAGRAVRFARLKAKMEAVEEAPRRPVTWYTRWQPAMKIAAGILLLLGASLTGYLVLREPGVPGIAVDPIVHTIATTRGQRMSLRLGDGTVVLLAPASTLRFSASFGKWDRVVELEGEAAFTVTHDEERPFAVRTATFVARDLGTRFVVQAYPDDSVSHVVVAEGEVAVARGAAADSVVLSEGDGARISPDAGITVAHDVALESYFGWTEGRLVFRRASLGEAVRQIERWHDVQIRLASPALADRRFSATFERGESAAEMLQVIGAVLDLGVRQVNRRSFQMHAR